MPGGFSLVLAACMGVALNTLYLYTLGVLIEPIQQEFGWSRAAISLGLTIISVCTVIGSPYIGRLIDRAGSRPVALVGVCLYSSALLLLPFSGPAIWTWWLGWLLVAVGSVLIKPTVWSAAIVSRFEKHRGIALAFALCGSGLASLAGPPAVHWLTESYGWRSAYWAIGGFGWLIVLPVIWFLFFDARALSRSGQGAAPVPPSGGLSAAEGFRSRSFIQLAAAGFLATAAGTAILVHFVPIVTSAGLDRQAAASAASAFGVMTLVGRVLTGFLLDRLDGRWIGALAFGLPVFAPVILMGYDGSLAGAIVAAGLIGLAIGAEIDVLAFLAARYFGLRNYGLLWGTIVGLIALGSGTGPFVAGLIYDLTGGYQPLFYLVIPGLLLGAVLLASLPRAPEFGGAH